MKLVIISDVHANLAALMALPEERWDQLWCVGDLVNYGPNPHEVIRWIRQNVSVAVRGNHDHAIGFNTDPQCSPPFKKLAAEAQHFTQKACTKEDIAYLRALPIQKELRMDSISFYLVHAVPTDPLFGYCPEQSERWQKEVKWTNADVLVVGHTHTPFVRKLGRTTIINPGSLGQPKTGRPRACYAVWQDGEICLKEYEYALTKTITDIYKMPISRDAQDGLIDVLETGVLPSRYYTKGA